MVANGATLTRVTIVSGRQDTNPILLQADFSSGSAGTPSLDPQPETPRLVSYDAQTVSAGTAAPAAPRGKAGGAAARISSYRSPVEQYALTQRNLDDEPAAALIDVHA